MLIDVASEASMAPSCTSVQSVRARVSSSQTVMYVGFRDLMDDADLQLAAGMIGKVRVTCPECSGEGERLREKDRCKKCHGAKVAKVKKRVEFMVEPGTLNGERIALKGEADEAVSVDRFLALVLTFPARYSSRRRRLPHWCQATRIVPDLEPTGLPRLVSDHLHHAVGSSARLRASSLHPSRRPWRQSGVEARRARLAA